MTELQANSHFLDQLNDEYFQKVRQAKGEQYAMQATCHKWFYASEWWNSLKPWQQIDNVFNRRALRKIYFN